MKITITAGDRTNDGTPINGAPDLMAALRASLTRAREARERRAREEAGRDGR